MKSTFKNQRGIALILSLGILSLLLVMAIAFATNSILTRKSAANSSNQFMARILARSAVARLQGQISEYIDNSLTDFSGIHSVSKGTVLDDQLTGDDSLLKVFIDPQTIYPKTKPQWTLIYDKYASPGNPASDAKIIGRIAYYVVPTLGQINFSEVVRGYNDNWNNRFGVDMKEFNITNSSTIGGWSDFLQTAKDKVTADGDYGSSFDDFFSAAPGTAFSKISAVPTMTINDFKGWFQDWFSLNNRNEAEIYLYQPKAVANAASYDKESAIKYHRFNLARNDWKDLGIENINLSSTDRSALVDRLLGKAKAFNPQDTETPADSGLQFLRMIGHTTDADSTGDSTVTATINLERRRKQIAANLIDYCTEKSIAVTSDQADWWTNPPTYTGNKKTPYINKVAIGLKSTNMLSVTTSGTTTIKRSAAFSNVTSLDNIAIEVINLYGITMEPMTMRIRGSIDVSITHPADVATAPYNGETTTTPLSFSFDKTLSSANSTRPSLDDTKYCYFLSPSDSTEQQQKTTLTSYYKEGESIAEPTVKFAVTNIKIDQILLTHNSMNVDFTRELSATSSTTSVFSPVERKVSTDGAECNIACIAGFAVDDPRVNLYQADNWSAMMDFDDASATGDTAEIIKKTASTKLYFGQQHKDICKPSDGIVTPDAANDIMNVSTIFIREEPMKSPWELAAISRGTKWKTINITAANSTFSHISKYDPNAALTDEGTLYSDGDGGILDQIKMTVNVFDSPKLDLNSRDNSTDPPKEIFKALVEKVKTKDAVFATGSTLTGTDISPIAAEAIGLKLASSALSNTNKTNPLFGRAELLYSDYNKTGTYANAFTELGSLSFIEQAALVGKTIALTTTNPPASKIIQAVVVAQSIKDNGGVTISKYKNNTNTIPISKDTTSGTFDYDSINKIYFDEITGEAKLLVNMLVLPPFNQLQVVSATFVEE